MKRLYAIAGLIVLVVLCTAAAPPPAQPTPVITGLNQHLGSDGRYYSTLAPFSLRSPWRGMTYNDQNGQRDRFSRGARFIDVVSFANSRNFNTDTINRAAEAALHQNGFTPRIFQVLTVNQQHVPVLVFADRSGSYAESIFILAGRAWVFALISDSTHSRADLADFSLTIRSFRVEHTGT